MAGRTNRKLMINLLILIIIITIIITVTALQIRRKLMLQEKLKKLYYLKKVVCKEHFSWKQKKNFSKNLGFFNSFIYTMKMAKS